jgi:4-amino-4-deoxy-L-arabinose transferase-like glycosyltransferase
VGLVLAFKLELGVDESHYMLYARHLGWSYFDHPPLVGWVHAIFNFLFGENLVSARLPALLAGVYCQYQLRELLKRAGLDLDQAGVISFSVSVFSFSVFVLSFLFLPDTLATLVLFWPLTSCVSGVVKKPQVRKRWWALGLVLGFMGLSKYTAILFVIPIFVVFVGHLGFRFLKWRGFYESIFLGALIVSPVFYWNYHNDWVSFKFQTGHVLGGHGGFESVIKSGIAQFALVGVFLWWFCIPGFLKLARGKSAELRFAFWTTVTFGSFFLVSSFQDVVLPHWVSQVYLLVIPFGLWWGFENWPRLTRWAIALSGGVWLVVVLVLVTPVGFRVPGLMKELVGWQEVGIQIASLVRQSKQNIVVLNWTYGSRLRYWMKDQGDKVRVADSLFDQHDVWNGSFAPAGSQVWLVQWSYDLKNAIPDSSGALVFENRLKCQTVSHERTIPIIYKQWPQYEVHVYRCSEPELL